MANLVPYSSAATTLPDAPGEALAENHYHSIHFTFASVSEKDAMLKNIEAWFDNREEVILAAHGTTANGYGFIVMEWEEVSIDPLFLAILEHEDAVDDISIYERDGEA